MVILINDCFNYRLIKYATFRFNFNPLGTMAINLTVVTLSKTVIN